MAESLKQARTGWRLILCLMILFLERPVSSAGSEPETILGSCSTMLVEDDGRTTNIRLALNRLENLVILPGDLFSFNRHIGPRSARRGFLPAPVLFQDRRSIQIGGGICQVSSTLYNAALLSDMEILERHRHSSPITYLPLGLDATVSYGYKDLKFKNGFAFPVKVVTTVVGNALTISIVSGTKLPYEVELVTEITEFEAPFSGGSAETGKEVMRYRLRKKNGMLLEREYLGRDYYHPTGG